MSSEETPQEPSVVDGETLPSHSSERPSLRARRVTKDFVAEPPRDNIMPTGRATSPRTGTFRLGRTFTTLLIPPKPLGETPSNIQSLKAAIMASWLNVLLVFIPVSWAMHFAKQNDIIIFVFSFLAIIPLAKLLGFATEELAIRVGQTIGGLLNATLGNAVELIVAIIALTQCKLNIVQSSLVGSILSNILLVLGMCFFAGGMKFSEQGFLASASNVNSSLLTISVIALLIPAAFIMAINNGQTTLSVAQEGKDVLKMSRGVAVVLLFIYGSYLVFQLWSHAHLYDEDAEETGIRSTKYPERKRKRNATNSADDPEAGKEESEEVEVEQPKMSVVATIILLAVVTVLVAVTAEWLVDSIDGVTQKGGISTQWVGLILLPIVGNAAEHVTAVTVSVKDKLTLSLGVAVGSSIQIALFVIPFITILAWIMGKPLTLLFDPFQSVVLFLAVLTVNYCVQDGKSNWLEGMILMCLYVIIAVSFWFYPGEDISGSLLTCT
ncbi:Calcium/proton exchanger [Gautieria morchelliformis]|nr:Calcium/proton exchanger [Gautieria morchelliformis]